MSWKATAVIRELQTAMDGTRFRMRQKLIYLLLGEAHVTYTRCAQISQEELAMWANTSPREVRRHIDWLVEHGEIGKHVFAQGAGGIRGYLLFRVDGPPGSFEPLPFAKKADRGVRFNQAGQDGETGHSVPFLHGNKEDKKRTREANKADKANSAIRNIPVKESEPVKNITPNGALTSPNDTGLTQDQVERWLKAKAQLQLRFPGEAWARAARLLDVKYDVAFIALPPNNAIMQAAIEHKAELSAFCQQQGFSGAMLTRYPDAGREWREEAAEHTAKVMGSVGAIAKVKAMP